MNLRRRSWLLAAVGASLCCAGQAQAPVASEAVRFEGAALQAPRSFTPAELAAQQAQLLASFTQSRGRTGQESRSTVRGVRLAALIEKVGLTADARTDWKNLLVTVTATDGYRAHFTWAELSNSPVGEGALLLFERDGRALDSREGGIALLSGADHRLGARHVRNAVLVEVRRIPD